MEQVHTANQILESIYAKTGVFALYGRPATGKTALMLQVADEINKRKAGTALIFSLEVSEALMRRRMQQLGISDGGMVIDDAPHPTAKQMERRIKRVGNVSILCIDYLQLMEKAAREQLPWIAEEFDISILAVGVLGRKGYEEDEGVYLCAQNGN